MTYLTTELITNAYYISNIVSRDFETPSASQVNDGLNILNDIIADKTINSSLIPYSDNLELNASAGVDNYFIENLIYIETFTFFIDGTRFQTRNQQRKDFFGSFRQVNIESLPFNWHTERELGGSRLFLYFVPDVNYPMEIWGSFRLSQVSLFQDLSLSMDRFYINFLKFELAVRLCKEFGYNIPPMVEKQLQDYYQWISGQSNTMDLKTQKLSTLTGGGAINYALVNLSNGWVPVP